MSHTVVSCVLLRVITLLMVVEPTGDVGIVQTEMCSPQFSLPRSCQRSPMQCLVNIGHWLRVSMLLFIVTCLFLPVSFPSWWCTLQDADAFWCRLSSLESTASSPLRTEKADWARNCPATSGCSAPTRRTSSHGMATAVSRAPVFEFTKNSESHWTDSNRGWEIGENA